MLLDPAYWKTDVLVMQGNLQKRSGRDNVDKGYFRTYMYHHKTFETPTPCVDRFRQLAI